MTKFAFDDIEEAFEFVNASPYGEHRAVICKDTGKILVQSEIADVDEIGDTDEDSEDWVDVPDKNDLDLGQHLVWAFVEDRIPNEYDQVRAMFQRSGAYRRFKDFLDDKDLLEAWYEFEGQSQEKALREWCRENDIELSD
jgi:hypothetical protein